eukprot:gb/GEZJ01000211.1/.p3 GENE.gb/GEZJ01000211.1/~~gb/GEZJ01000211.1/.p3  ORF type:complete len:157 (+),score=10.18 gb/GEZJ01000211.1/:380-850(+)
MRFTTTFATLLPLFLFVHRAAAHLPITAIFCNSEDGCATDDGWQLSCPLFEPIPNATVRVLKSISVNDFYIVLDSISLPESSLMFAINPSDSPVQTIPPDAVPPPEEPFLPEEVVNSGRLARFPRCTRRPPGVFRNGRYFPFGVAFGSCCRPCRIR